jgi:hypothetical protein
LSTSFSDGDQRQFERDRCDSTFSFLFGSSNLGRFLAQSIAVGRLIYSHTLLVGLKFLVRIAVDEKQQLKCHTHV